MPSYTLDKLLEKMEPQNRRDMALIGRCTDRLGLYAAQIAENDRTSPKIQETRNLVETLAGYWGLDDKGFTANAKSLDDFLAAFDDRGVALAHNPEDVTKRKRNKGEADL